VTVDADATPERGVRRGRSPFELLRFTATPVPGALVVVEIEGRVAAASERFARRPVLVVEASAAADRPRLELAPSRSALDGDRWRATYAIPAEAYDAARFALGLRGTLLDLPAPDEPTDAERGTLLAREANRLRRQLEAAEADAAAARAEATAAAGELGAAVSAARDGALAESAERIADLERATAETRAAHDEALAGSAERIVDLEREVAEARAANEAALADLQAAHDRATTESAERRAAEADAERRRADDAEARALAAEEGIAVLRAELAEERERLEALRRAEEAEGPTTPGVGALWAASDPADDEDETRVLASIPDEDDDTRPFTTREERTAVGEPLLPLERGALQHPPPRRGPGAYVAVAALILFVVLLALLLGFMG
jgi:colicin import membrane protein